MNLIYGEIVALSSQRGLQIGKVRVGGAIKAVSLDFISAAQIGEIVLVCDGVAIAKVEHQSKTEDSYVPSNTGEAH
ncbi:MAG TPA: HypC/HybG/HupF family hydrogenase formation chaperone [Chthoniobacterales bacterium]|jgi:hydrogenase maturation factor|nr:HypC/HybG/HupF family hydrogenase formation chaperone [Chthoniobacterales bacterium]